MVGHGLVLPLGLLLVLVALLVLPLVALLDEIPDPDIEEVPLSDRFEDVTDDPSAMELCTEDPDPPEGYEFADLCPALSNKKEMLNKHILFRWDCGWAEGVIKRRHTKAGYNYFVLYQEDDGSSNQYRHDLKPHNYYSADQPEGFWPVWVMLVKTAIDD